MLLLVRVELDEPVDVLELSSSVLLGIISETLDTPDESPHWCRTVTMEEYGHGRHDRVRDELVQQWVHDPSAWSRRGDKVVFRSEDIHGTITKLKRDILDYLYGSGSGGNVIVFDAAELEKFLGVSLSQSSGPLKTLARLFGR